MSGRKRSLETISFEVAMTTAALLARRTDLRPHSPFIFSKGPAQGSAMPPTAMGRPSGTVRRAGLDRPCAIAICRLSCNACRLQRKRRPVTAPKMKCPASGH